MKSLLIALTLISCSAFATTNGNHYEIKKEAYVGTATEQVYTPKDCPTCLESKDLSQLQVEEILSSRKVEVKNGEKVLEILLKVTHAEYNSPSAKYQNVQFITATLNLSKALYNEEYGMTSAPSNLNIQFNGKDNEEMRFADQSGRCVLDSVSSLVHCDSSYGSYDQKMVFTLK
jgi:hypothetical protein